MNKQTLRNLIYGNKQGYHLIYKNDEHEYAQFVKEVRTPKTMIDTNTFIDYKIEHHMCTIKYENLKNWEWYFTCGYSDTDENIELENKNIERFRRTQKT